MEKDKLGEITSIMMRNLKLRKVPSKALQQVRNDLLGDLEHIQEATEWLVLATPSGEVRNKLTEVNIHLMAAEAALKEVV